MGRKFAKIEKRKEAKLETEENRPGREGIDGRNGVFITSCVLGIVEILLKLDHFFSRFR